MIPYARQLIDEQDVEAVVKALSSPWLTTGPCVERFEKTFATVCCVRHAVTVSSGTAALHAAMFALGVLPGDEVIVPSLTFVATANAVVYMGATPVFADVNPETLLLDPASVESKITARTKGIIAVDYAGQPCDYEALQLIASRHQVFLHADACHALGAFYLGRPVGSLADASSFSFHAVKPITTAEGGMITTNDEGLARKLRTFRNHGITTDFRERETKGTWHYDMEDLGYNYRLSDLQSALGLSQLSKIDSLTARRQEIAARYDSLFKSIPQIVPLGRQAGSSHAYHLYAVRLQKEWSGRRAEFFQKMRARGIALNVHYRPVYQHSFYVKTYGDQSGSCPAAEKAYENLVSIPLFAGLSDEDFEKITASITAVLNESE